MNDFIFDPTTVEPSTGSNYELIPPGDYKLIMTDAEYKSAQSNPQNKVLKAIFQIVEGEFKNRYIYVNFNLVNVNPTAQLIGQQEFSAFCHAINMGGAVVRDLQPLLNKVFIGIIGVEKANEKNPEPKNRIRKYKTLAGLPIGATPPSAGVQAPQAALATAPTTGTAVPPWAK